MAERIVNVDAPIVGTDAANKEYVDSAVKKASARRGNLDLHHDRIVNLAPPISPTDAANRKYVDQAVASVSAKDGKDGKDGRDGADGKDGRGVDGKNGVDGKDGAPGPKGDDGKPGQGLSLKGDWSKTEPYDVGDVVSFLGNSWAAVAPNFNVAPTIKETTKWQLIASRGAQGPGSRGQGGGGGSADQIAFGGEYATVADALNALLYVPMDVTAFAGDHAGAHEVGETVSNIHLTWTLNKAATSLAINNGVGSLSPSATSHDVTADLTTNQTWMLTASDGTTQDTASVSVSFLRKRHWGASASESLDSAGILALSGSEFATNFNRAVTYDCTGGKYPHFAYPSSFGVPSAVTVGGLAFSDFSVSVVSHTNASGHTEDYNVLRLGNIQTGSNIAIVWQ